jgi:4-amino-4-deoxy-L-arabinose transferase-like glycosyltransferase
MALGLVVRVAYVLTVGSRTGLGADATWYLLEAGIIGSGDGYLDPDAYFARGDALATANFPPLWPALLAIVEWLGLGGEQAYRLVGAGLGTITVGLTGLLGRRVGGARVGLVAAALVACSPLLIAADGSLMSETMYAALLTAALWSAYRAIDRPSAARMVLLGALGGLAVLTRSDGVVIVTLLVAATVITMDGSPPRRRFALAGVALAAVLAVVAPWGVRNIVRLDSTVPLSSNAGSVVEGANCPSTYAGELLGAWDPDCLVETRRSDRSEAAWSAAARNRGLDYAASHAGRLPVVAGARVARTFGVWNPAAAARLEAVESRSAPWQVAGWAYGSTVLVLAVAGYWSLIRRGADVGPLLATVVGVVVVVAASWGNQRFRVAAEPALSVGAAAAVVGVAAVRARRRARTSSGG